MNLAHISRRLIFITAIAILTSEKLDASDIPDDIPDRLVNYVIPMHYNIKLQLTLEKYKAYLPSVTNKHGTFHLSGQANVTINVLQSTSYINLHGLTENSNPWEILVMSKYGERNDIDHFTIKQHESLNISEIAKMYFKNILFPGIYILNVKFRDESTNNDIKIFFRNFYINKEKNKM